MEIINVETKGKSYSINIESGLFKKLPAILEDKCKGKKIALVSDSNVFSLYGRSLTEKLTQSGLKVTPVLFDAGEERKNLATLYSIYHTLAEEAFTRTDVVVALGGGVTGDLAGLAAATFLRGIGFIQVPTSLLAMVDSSIGGKAAVDLPQGKNLVGAFYQPDAVYTDPDLLSTLSDRHFSDGVAELLKHGIIRDVSLFGSLAEDNSNMVSDWSIYDIDRVSARKFLEGRLDAIIAKSCMIKRDIVQEDEHDNGIRQLLNFGHTLGHAIERVHRYSGPSHGEAISIGMVVITRLTESMGLTEKGVVNRIIKALTCYGLPVSMPPLDACELISAIKSDKKNRSGTVTLAYIEKIGAGRLFRIDLKELEERIHGILTNLPKPC